MVTVRTQEQYESGGGRPGLPVPNKLYGFCGRKATVKRSHEALLVAGHPDPVAELGGLSVTVIGTIH